MGMWRPHLERAMFEEGMEGASGLADAIGFDPGTVRSWLSCRSRPGRDGRRAIASAFGLDLGSDSEDVWGADVDWLLEPCERQTTDR